MQPVFRLHNYMNVSTTKMKLDCTRNYKNAIGFMKLDLQSVTV